MNLLQMISGVAELTGATLTKPGLEIMEMELKRYPPADVRRALERCIRELKSPLTLGAVLDRLPARNDWPGADEAWSIALAGQDEQETVVTCDEIAIAFGEASRILPDRTGARMAFKAIFERLVSAAQADDRLPVWFISPGRDPERRAAALHQAVELKRLAPEYAQKHLPAPPVDPQVIAGMLEAATPTQRGDKELANLKAMLGKKHLRLVKGAA